MAYTKQTWTTGETIVASKLNNIETAIYNNSVSIDELNTNSTYSGFANDYFSTNRIVKLGGAKLLRLGTSINVALTKSSSVTIGTIGDSNYLPVTPFQQILPFNSNGDLARIEISTSNAISIVPCTDISAGASFSITVVYL